MKVAKKAQEQNAQSKRGYRLGRPISPGYLLLQIMHYVRAWCTRENYWKKQEFRRDQSLAWKRVGMEVGVEKKVKKAEKYNR